MFDRIMSKGSATPWRPGFITWPDAKEKQFRAKTLKFARKTGIPLRHTPGWAFQWDGKRIATHKQTHSSILHDIAHWCVAAPERRRVKEFGLGPGPDAEGTDAPYKVHFRTSQKEEERASILGILIELHLGMYPANTMEYHNWTGWDSRNLDGEDDFGRTVSWLIKRGLIDTQGKLLKIGEWSADKNA